MHNLYNAESVPQLLGYFHYHTNSLEMKMIKHITVFGSSSPSLVEAANFIRQLHLGGGGGGRTEKKEEEEELDTGMYPGLERVQCLCHGNACR